MPDRRSLFFTVSLVAFAGSVSFLRADWPQFRGPDGQGHANASSLPLKWSETENVTWKQELPGIAWSSPVIQNGRIYLTTALDLTPEAPAAAKDEKSKTDEKAKKDDNAQKDDKSKKDAKAKKSDKPKVIELNVLCLAAETGSLLWKSNVFTQTGTVEFHKKNSHASPTPIVTSDALYVHFGPHGTARLALDGAVVWKQKLEYSPTHGNGGSPALTDGLLIICCDGSDVQYVSALDVKTGDIRWKTPRDTKPSRGFSFSTPLVIDVAGVPQAICPGSDAVFAYEPTTGKEIWRVRYADGFSVIPRPTFGDGLLYICTGYARPKLLAIDPTGKGDVTDTHVRWKTDKQVPHSSSPVLDHGLIFFVSDGGIACCMDAKTGTEHWRQRIGGNFSASTLAGADRIYFQDEAGKATIVAAAPEFKELAVNELPSNERTYASYAIDGSALFLRSEKHLYRIEEKR